MIDLIKFLVLILGSLACSGIPIKSQQHISIQLNKQIFSTEKNIKENSTEKHKLDVKVFKNKSGWGYDIYRAEKLYIHQPHIPAISGNQTFQSEEDARRTGELIILKIRKNIIPPTISKAELDSLGILPTK